MTDRLHPLLRVLAGLLALLTVFLAFLPLFSFGITMVGGGGFMLGGQTAVGVLMGLVSFFSAFILLHVARTGQRLNRVRTVIALVGPPMALVAAAVQTEGWEHDYHMRRQAITDMRSDLNTLRTAQDSFFAMYQRYAGNPAELGPLFSLSEREYHVVDFKGGSYGKGFTPGSGLSEPTIVVGKGWWTATNTHQRVPGLVCGVAVNAANPISGDTANSSEPACR